ncbi:BnaA09g00780D [Brassica napus]|uniref:non-specific serine/threonine protein kinase n=1 Tax=Brassica napus TaxID=3708 RepID=A0A078G9N1_BRANA|nr:BnaA09g00780D [Brassica napus]
MFVKLLTIVFFFFSLLSQLLKSSSQSVNNFTYNGFHLPLTLISIQGKATVTPNGLLKLTHSTMYMTGHAFYNQPIRFKDSPNSTVSSFSTTFVFAIIPQVWVDYDGLTNQIDVTMAPFNHDKPIKPLVSTVRDLSSILLQDMFVGFSASTGAVVSQHFVLGWSFQVKGKAPPLDLQTLPKLPELQSKRKGIPPLTAFYFAVTLLALLFFLSLLLREFVKFIFRRKIKFEEELEDWETDPSFRLLPSGKGASSKVTLDWKQRIKVIKGVASALFYLHEDWEQVVIHRDIKSSNVLLDAEYNGRLGDFGLARLCGHGTDPQTSHVAGTWGYLAPDHMRTGKTTTATDVFSFGVLLLEVACGRRPIEVHKKSGETVLLVDWVFGFWSEGNILDAKDPNLGTEFDQREVEMILKLGQVLHYLSGDSMLPDFSPLDLRGSEMMLGTHHGLSMTGIGMFTGESSMVDSVLSGGR